MLDPSRILAWQRAVTSLVSGRGQALVRRIASLGFDESTVLLGFAVIIGAAVGLAVIVFYKAIDLAQALALTTAGSLTGFAGRLSIFVVVLAGLAVARALVRYGTQDSDAENVADVMRAVAKRGGVIHATPVAFKSAAAALAIGTGGSVGAEGPIAVAGAALGSRIGRFFRSSPNRLKLLVACGAASGISAAFNAPIAGVFFSLEKVLGTFAVSAFPPVLIASVIAALIARAAFGNSPVIAIPTEYGVGSAGEFILYALLGLATGVVSVLYTRGVHRAPDLLSRWRPALQVLVAALVVGGLDMVFRNDLWGRGHETLTLGILTQRDAWFLVALAFAKLTATAFTLAATRAGGVFTPALFIGATLGGGLAVGWSQLLPGLAIVPEAFALVGMAGLIAGATHAPLTAIMIVFEMTGDYALILPLMVCGAIAYITARRLHPQSIYSEWLARRGEQITAGQDVAILERLTVTDCFNRKPHSIREDATVKQILRAIGASRQTEFPVLDADRHLVGMITYDDLRTVLASPDELAPVVLASDLARQDFEHVTPTDSLRTALRRLAVRGSHYLPVVDGGDGQQLLGLISREDILTAYDRELLKQG